MKKTANDLLRYVSSNDQLKLEQPFITTTGGEIEQHDFEKMYRVACDAYEPLTYTATKPIIGEVFLNPEDGLTYMYTKDGLKSLNNEGKTM